MVDWSQKEINKLKQMYSNNYLSEIKMFFPNRTLKSMQHKASRLGLKKSEEFHKKIMERLHTGARRLRTWTEEERKLLIEKYPNSTKKQLKKQLSRHNYPAIQAYAHLLGLHKTVEIKALQSKKNIKTKKPWIASHKDDTWTDNEIKLLKENYPDKSMDILEKILNKSERAIWGKAHILRLYKSEKYLKELRTKHIAHAFETLLSKVGWNEEEISILNEHWYRQSKEKILEMLSNRTWNAIQDKAHKLGINRDSSFVIREAILRGDYNPASWTQKKPTNPEKIIIDIIKKYKLPYKYVGNGAVIIYGLNPDFINCNGEKKIIEVFGRVFHDPNKTFKDKIKKYQTEEGRKEIFGELGYSCLVLWDDELKNLTESEIVDQIKNI